MKNILKKIKGLAKGTPTAVLVSIGIHVILLFFAGTWVVFTIIEKQDQKFVPVTHIERPKMKLKKLRVKVKQNTKPRQSVQRIVTKTIRAMPDIQLPEMTGLGGCLADGVGGFDAMMESDDMGLFGGKNRTLFGNEFAGTFYSMEMTRSGKFEPIGVDGMNQVVQQFVEEGWNPKVFAPYYKAPGKMYATHFMIPPIPSEQGPSQFGIKLSETVSPAFWVIHYKGEITRPEGGRFRFRGTGDNFFIVRVNQKIVLATSFAHFYAGQIGTRMSLRWSPTDEQSGKFLMGHGFATVGDWFDLEPGAPVEMEVIAGDYWGGWFKAMLVVEEEGQTYPKNEDGMPILPIFRTEKIPEKLKNELVYLLTPNEVDLDSDLKFNIY